MDCIFCRIASGEVPANKVYEDGSFLAFLDINPRNPGHTLVITKEHYNTLTDVPEAVAGEYMKVIGRVTKAAISGTKADGANVLSNIGRAAGSLVPHVHFHVIPRFGNEGPVSPEVILGTKKLDQQAMAQLAQSISSGLKSAPKQELKEGDRPPSKSEPPAAKEREWTDEELELFDED